MDGGGGGGVGGDEYAINMFIMAAINCAGGIVVAFESGPAAAVV